MNGQHPAVALTSQVTALLDDAGELSVFGLAGAEVDMLIEEQLTVISRLQTMLADVVEQAAVLDRPAQLAAPSMAAWLRGRFGFAPAAATRLVRDVADLRAAPTAAQAARLGAIPVQAAVEIGHAVTALPDEVGPAIRAEGAAVLLGFAVGDDGPPLAAYELRLAGRHLHEILDPDAADLLLAQRLEREERAVYRRRFLSITDDHDSGGVRLRGLLTVEAGASLRAVLGPLTAPRPATATLGATGDTGDGGVGENGLGAVGGDATPGSGPELPLPDERSGGQRSADALHEACERLLAQGDLPASGGDRPQILITVDHDRLAAGIAAATLPDGGDSAPPRSGGSPATPDCSPPSSAPPANPWTSAAPHAPPAPPNAAHSSSATAAAPSPAAIGRPASARPTTSSHGRTSARPTSRTSSSSAASTTA